MLQFYDLLPLPSKGFFYKDNNDNLKINYITTFDQIQLTSPNLINQDFVINYLLQEKVCDFNIDDLLVQDKNAILFHLRELALGSNVYYSLSNEEITLDLNNIPYKSIDNPPYEGSYQYVLDNHIIKFSPITYGQEKKIINESKLDSSISNSLFLNYLIDDITIEGNSILNNNKLISIIDFFKKIKYVEYNKFKKFYTKILNFGYDLDYKFNNEDNNLNINIKIDSYFFHCSIENHEEYKKLLFSEINSLVTDGNYDYNAILSMPSHHRRGNVNALVKNFQIKDEAHKKEMNKIS